MKLIVSICRSFVFVIAFILLSQISFSQKKQFKGYYITQQGDTVKGFFPNFKQWNNNPDKVNFISISNGAEVTLTPLTCKEFAIENYDTYRSYQGKRLTNPIEYNNATGDNANTYDTITTFLRQVAATDRYKFYVYKDDIRINLFYADGNKIIELQQKGAIINNNFWESMTYKQQLKELFTSETDKEKIDELSYTEESLASFINKQNRGRANFKQPKNNSNGFIIMAGGSLNSLKFTGDKSVDYSNKDYPSNIVPVAAIGYMSSISRNDKFFLFPQLKIFSFKHTARTQYSNSNLYPGLVNTFQSSAVISFGFHFGYNIVNNDNLKFFIAPGGGVSLLTKNKQTDNYQYTETQGKTIVTAMPGTTYLFDVQTAVIFGKKYVAWLSYNLPASITSYSANKGYLSAIQLGIGYKL